MGKKDPTASLSEGWKREHLLQVYIFKTHSQFIQYTLKNVNRSVTI